VDSTKRVILLFLLLSRALAAETDQAAGSSAMPKADQNPLSSWVGAGEGTKQTYRLPVNGLIMVQYKDKFYFTTPNARYLIRGEIYDTWNGKYLTSIEEAKKLGERIQLANLKLDIDKELSPFYIGEGRHEVVIFVDPYCPYCNKLLQQIEKLDKKRYRFKLLLVPVLGDKSAETIRLLMCGSDPKHRNEDVVARLLKKEYAGLKNERCDPQPFLKTAILAQILGVEGVPFLINQDGRVLRGYVEDLKAFLESGDAS
jgi:thiol:disulfide interchange protein DsbC